MIPKNKEIPALVILWTTVETQAEASELAASMLERRLAACVQIDSPIQSHYSWQGRLHADTEQRLIIKTRATLTQTLIHWLQENHPYDEPQILVTAVTEASPGYASWVMEQTIDAQE